MARWVEYFQSLLNSDSPEVSTIARIAAADLRTTTVANNWLILDLGLRPSTATSAEVREKLREAKPAETEEQMARLGLLMELLEHRGIKYYEGEEDN